jgi:hypothetical protein
MSHPFRAVPRIICTRQQINRGCAGSSCLPRICSQLWRERAAGNQIKHLASALISSRQCVKTRSVIAHLPLGSECGSPDPSPQEVSTWMQQLQTATRESMKSLIEHPRVHRLVYSATKQDRDGQAAFRMARSAHTCMDQSELPHRWSPIQVLLARLRH